MATALSAGRYKRELSLDNLPVTVLIALRDVLRTHDEHVKKLSAEDRMLLAAALHHVARYQDLMAQVDANGFGDGH